MVVSIVGELEDMGREEGLLLGGIAKLCGIFVENGIRVAWDIFMGVYDDQGGGINGGIYVVSEETFPEAGDNYVVRGVWKVGEVGDILELLMVGGLPAHRHREEGRLLAGWQLSRRRSW